jgi:DNA-binding response OmpR family regulator
MRDELDRVRLLEMGADDYMVKPFGLRGLVARMRAVQRRAGRAEMVPPPLQRIGALAIDRGARRAWLHADEVELTPKEFDLLAFLAERPGIVRTREDIMQVWDEHWWGRRRLWMSTWLRCDASSVASTPSRRCAGSATGSIHRSETVARRLLVT